MDVHFSQPDRPLIPHGPTKFMTGLGVGHHRDILLLTKNKGSVLYMMGHSLSEHKLTTCIWWRTALANTNFTWLPVYDGVLC